MGSNPARLGPYKKRSLGHRPAQRERPREDSARSGGLQALDKGLGRNQPCRHLDLGHIQPPEPRQLSVVKLLSGGSLCCCPGAAVPDRQGWVLLSLTLHLIPCFSSRCTQTKPPSGIPLYAGPWEPFLPSLGLGCSLLSVLKSCTHSRVPAALLGVALAPVPYPEQGTVGCPLSGRVSLPALNCTCFSMMTARTEPGPAFHVEAQRPLVLFYQKRPCRVSCSVVAVLKSSIIVLFL